jgi:hypothetical protein
VYADDFPADVENCSATWARTGSGDSTGTNVPIGSKYPASSAPNWREKDLPYAFASHFAPRYMHETFASCKPPHPRPCLKKTLRDAQRTTLIAPTLTGRPTT